MVKARDESVLTDALGIEAANYLMRSLSRLGRLMPGLQMKSIRIERPGKIGTGVRWSSRSHYSLLMDILSLKHRLAVHTTVIRRPVPQLDGAPVRINDTEYVICGIFARRVSRILDGIDPRDSRTLSAVWESFDEQVVSDFLTADLTLEFDIGPLFRGLRRLAEQTYENRHLAFACIIDSESPDAPLTGSLFPDNFLGRKRFRALTDGIYTAYRISGKGAMLGLVDVATPQAVCPAQALTPSRYRGLTAVSCSSCLGVGLSKQGDILILGKCSLLFSYRHGRWHYWNHDYYLGLFAKALSGTVRTETTAAVAGIIYRAALDIAFRRTGALFVILRRADQVSSLVRSADQLGNEFRDPIDRELDKTLSETIHTMPLAIVVELASLDGAFVLDRHGAVLAYGAVLEPRRRKRPTSAEGSRTKAAIYASMIGVSVMISADGDISIYSRGEKLLDI